MPRCSSTPCPFCGRERVYRRESWHVDRLIHKRLNVCRECGKKFYSVELILTELSGPWPELSDMLSDEEGSHLIPTHDRERQNWLHDLSFTS
jgi:transcription elongation factor Elf1